MSTTFSAHLGDAARYERALERLYARHAGRRRLDRWSHAGVSLAQMIEDKARVARLLASTVSGGEYRPAPAHLTHVFVGDRVRELVRFEALDFVVHAVVGELLAEAMEPTLSPQLYSYRRRHSSWEAVRALATYVRRHQRSRREPRTRGLYVLRADVRKYADSVPVGDGSALWPALWGALGLALGDPQRALVDALVRPELLLDDDARACRAIGLALGSPIATLLLNLYLTPLDAALDRAHGAFYLRFGDNLVFCHENAAVVRDAEATINRVLAERGLRLNAGKTARLYFTGPGRPSDTWFAARPARAVPFLGCEVAFDGTVRLPVRKVRGLLADVRERLRRASRLLGPSTLDARAGVLCQVANETLAPGSALAHRLAVPLSALVTDRQQLREIDRLVASLVIGAATGDDDPRAQRRLPYRRLRREHGLLSLVVVRNDPERLEAARAHLFSGGAGQAL